MKAALWTAVLCFVFYRRLTGLIFTVPAGAVIYFREKDAAEKARRRSFNREFRDALRALKGRIGSGNSLENAFSLTLGDLKAMPGKDAGITGAFREIVRLQSLNIPAPECLYRTAELCGDSDMISFSRIVGAVSEKGGRMTDVIQRSTDRIAEKIDMEEGLETAVAGKKNEFRVMKLMPLLVITYLCFFEPGLMEVLYSSAAGTVVSTICLALYTAAWIWGERIAELRV